MAKQKISVVTHPDYDKEKALFKKYRLAYAGGKDFIETYLKKFSTRETYLDWTQRKEITYVPAYAKSALIDIKNAIHQRMVDVVRKDGPVSYQQAITGLNGGVDHSGNSIDSFMGNSVLDELLPMRKVGIFVDRLPVVNAKDARSKRPYLYIYRTEDIRSWKFDDQNRLSAVLLESREEIENEYALPYKMETVYLHYFINDEGTVTLRTYDSKSALIKTQTTDLTIIPLVIGELTQSLMTDIADYQIAAMNLASSDMNYAQKSNYPFYTEQYDPMSEYISRQAMPSDSQDIVNNNEVGTDGTASNASESNRNKIEVGSTQGRRYSKNLERPGFINPSPDPLRVSMEKQEVLKRETRELINLNLSSLRSVRESAESKREDSKGKEEGLSNIGLELEHMERQISEIWAMYEASEPTNIKYPANYSLRTDGERRNEADQLTEQATRLNSRTYQVEIAKEVAMLTMGHKVSQKTLNTIELEIEDAKVIFIDPENIRADHEAGLVATKTASEARGYPEGDANQAAIDHAERLARIAIAQGGNDTASGGEGERDAANERKIEQSIDANVTRGKNKE